ncbi:hypothetical protein M433DRAFT_430137 [Acidomyces richmondensis BFW]|nr:MAG: hypothetical protein FE78DRAFT_235569 [Acidomyces sp. 'richmondensis']KYG48311.1 hypothetical protein M433DRAFT_430137 [Acidomyces richmondensis BFW]
MLSQTLVVTAFVAIAAAQSSVLTFTHVPNPVTDGQPQAITYATNDTSSPVTIILRQGEASNLKTIETLTTTATGGQFIWTPSTSLPDGINYALEITQGNQVNYFGPLEVQGATASSSTSMSSSSSTTGVVAHSSSNAAPARPFTSNFLYNFCDPIASILLWIEQTAEEECSRHHLFTRNYVFSYFSFDSKFNVSRLAPIRIYIQLLR